MSSATNHKRGNFEEEFRRRLQDAEASPSADLWARIDHSLTVQENGQYKRGMLFYRQLAAACITLLLVAGGFAAYYFGGQPESPLAGAQPQMQGIAAVAPEQKAAAEAVAPDEAIASAMQAAVRPQEEQPRQKAPSQSIASAAPVAEAAATEAESMAKAETTAPGAWYSTRAGKYTAASQHNGNRQSINLSRAISSGSINASFLDRSNSAAGLMSSGRNQGFAEAVPNPVDDFRALNEAVISRMKQIRKEQESVLQTYKSDNKALAAVGVSEPEQGASAGGRWSLGMAYAPSYFEQNISSPAQTMGPVTSFASLAPSTAMEQSSRLMDEAREEHDQEMEPGFSFGVEVKAGMRVGKKWKLLGGLGFMQSTARSKSSYVMQQFWRNPGSRQGKAAAESTVFVPTLSSNYASDSLSLAKTDEFNVTYRYRHLTVPVGAQYEGNLGKDWFWYAGGGVAANILLQTSVLASSAEVKDIDYGLNDENSPFRKLQWSGNATAGVGKRLSNNLSVAIGPEYRAYFDTLLTGSDKAQAPQGKPYTIGINMALNYELGAGRR
ncbi:outer membrane protein with beta-barrel domain [Pontibacter mucosus]|uniref:Outer membrane protein with beta-barrel domain n=1 Tax=Pontibacter mucosus TaxID=1649266 RepID=A0A2T5YEV0_9BACT|nr:outer membrane beta-barrel protein [Pontibacter mucosus]PTX15244.1 outer membrane protein with beta-barrel domain [Pontibacter mucosus]